MYRTVNDFLTDWANASGGTIKVLDAMTDDKLNQAIAEGHNTLGWLGWHLSGAIVYFAGQVGLDVTLDGDITAIPDSAVEIRNAYEKISAELKNAVENLTDEQIVENVDSHGQLVPRGALLRMMIDHQTHHRGQMTVLLRQAGLKVPGIMGPTKEDAVTY